MTSYLTTDEIKTIHVRVMQRYGKAGALRDPDLLDSAANRPRQAAHYTNATLIEQAAILIEAIAMAHAFIDGNKRTADMVGGLFLKVNGLELTDPNGLARIIESLVQHKITVDDLATWLGRHTIPNGG